MSVVLLSVALMVGVTLAVHMGLLKAVFGLLSKVAGCAQCASFWVVLTWLCVCRHVAPVIGVAIAIGLSYVSNWLVLALVWLSNKYDDTWRRLTRE